MDVKDKVAVVTGASAGIGAATVKVLLKIGMKVVGLARRKERIEVLSGEEYEGRLFALSVDLRNTQEILDAFSWITENVGFVYVLINNAGIGMPTPIVNGNMDSWKSVMDTNFMSVATACREAIRIMQENEIDGHIINVNSVAGHFDVEGNLPGNVMYACSKRALVTLTENILLELSRINSKIRITSLSPGLVKTDILIANGASEAESDQFFSALPHLLSEDTADAVIYILSTPKRVQVTELIIRATGENMERMISTVSKQ